MNNITEMTLSELKARLEARELTSVEIITAYKEAYEKDQTVELPLNGYIEFFDDALEAAAASDKKRAEGKAGTLEGLPVAVKDNILIKGKIATAASGVLKGFKAPYSSTVVERLMDQGMIPIGRTNMDEFGMGSSCEYSIYGPTRNPVDRTRIPGGSSGGSAAVVAGGQAPCALGTETGGSIRLPAAFCGLYGLKPTYGALSRYGVIAFGSSLDQVGVLARNPEDLALIFGTGTGEDPNDATSEKTNYENLIPLKPRELKGMKIAVPTQFMNDSLDGEIKEKIENFKHWLTDQGAAVEELSIPILEATLAIYYIIAPAEASSNLARYDGVRFGTRAEDIVNLHGLYEKSRTQGFGAEVKRRIFIGNYVLSSGYYDAYYKKAMEVRTLLRNEVTKIFEKYDMILSPTAPCAPFKLGERSNDPLAMYLTDVCTIFVNLAAIPSVNIPCGKTGEGLPVGLQIIGPRFSEDLLLGVAKTWHNEEGK